MRKYSRTELDTLSAEEAADKAKDDEVRRLIRNAQYDDAGRLVLYYYHLPIVYTHDHAHPQRSPHFIT